MSHPSSRFDSQQAGPSRQTIPSQTDSPSMSGTPSASQPNSQEIDSPATDPARRSARRPPSRVIRTYQEVQVTKTINAEEWYEELECGVCAHVLGAPQTLVPCGHSLCGPCAWEWIKKNENLTCPHCRHQLHEALPFVPNIVVEQIITRKLQSLPDSPEKNNIIQERSEKAEAWKLIQVSIIKPQIPRRRTFDDTVFGFFGAENNIQSQHQRRASRNIPALGAPLAEQTRPAIVQIRRPTHPYGNGMNLAEMRRHEEDNHLPDRAEIRRLREASLREAQNQFHSPPLEILEEEIDPPRSSIGVPPSLSPPISTTANPLAQSSEMRRSRGGNEVPQGPRQLGARGLTLRSRVLADRQARGRVGSSRDQPLVVLSDSD